MGEVQSRVEKLIVEHLGVESEKVTREASFVDDLGADSLDVIELAMAVEEEFGIEVPDDEVNKIDTVGDLIDYVARVKD